MFTYKISWKVEQDWTPNQVKTKYSTSKDCKQKSLSGTRPSKWGAVLLFSKILTLSGLSGPIMSKFRKKEYSAPVTGSTPVPQIIDNSCFGLCTSPINFCLDYKYKFSFTVSVKGKQVTWPIKMKSVLMITGPAWDFVLLNSFLLFKSFLGALNRL